MRITYKTDYALKAILELSCQYYENKSITIHTLAKRLDIPLKFLEQILLELKKFGILESKRGKIGGYFLTKPPSQIKLGEVLRFIDGPIEPIACLDNDYRGCGEISYCVFRRVWKDIDNKIKEVVDNITFEDLLKERRRIEKESLIYFI